MTPDTPRSPDEVRREVARPSRLGTHVLRRLSDPRYRLFAILHDTSTRSGRSWLLSARWLCDGAPYAGNKVDAKMISRLWVQGFIQDLTIACNDREFVLTDAGRETVATTLQPEERS